MRRDETRFINLTHIFIFFDKIKIYFNLISKILFHKKKKNFYPQSSMSQIIVLIEFAYNSDRIVTNVIK